MDDILSTLLENLKLAVERLQFFTAHDALVLLKTCLGGPKLQYILRVSPCREHPLLTQFDDQLRLMALHKDLQHYVNGRPVDLVKPTGCSGGLGVRSVAMLASSAFSASAAGTLSLQSQILRNTQAADGDTSTALKHWLSISGVPCDDSFPVGNQRVLDSIVVQHAFQTLLRIKQRNITEPDFLQCNVI